VLERAGHLIKAGSGSLYSYGKGGENSPPFFCPVRECRVSCRRLRSFIYHIYKHNLPAWELFSGGASVQPMLDFPAQGMLLSSLFLRLIADSSNQDQKGIVSRKDAKKTIKAFSFFVSAVQGFWFCFYWSEACLANLWFKKTNDSALAGCLATLSENNLII
jgi:hypothetical protein